MDADLRAAARRGLAGDQEGGARAIQGRLRSGQLAEEAVRIAALCGHEGCLLVLGIERPVSLGTLMNETPEGDLGTSALARGALEAWKCLLVDWTPRASTRAAEERLAAGEAWAASGVGSNSWTNPLPASSEVFRRWSRTTSASHLGVLPRPEWGWGPDLLYDTETGALVNPQGTRHSKFWLARTRMTGSISSAVDKRTEWIVGAGRTGYGKLRSQAAELVRGQIEQRVINWLLNGGV